MDKKKFLFLLGIAITLFFALMILFSDLKNNKIENFLQDKTLEKSKQYEMVYNSFRKIAINSFHSTIDKEEVKTLLAKGNSQVDQDRTRKELYKLLKKDYRVFKMLGMKYFHFHLANGKTFLRFDDKKHHGDNISEFRPSIKYVIDHQLPFEGIEEGGCCPAFRFVYPLHNDYGEYIGSAEVSFDVMELKNVFERSFLTSVNIIFLKEALQNNSYIDIKQYFKTSQESSNYLIKKSANEIKFNQTKQISEQQLQELKPKIKKLMETKEHFSLHSYDKDKSQILTFLVLKNDVTDNIISYAVTYEDDKYIASLEQEFFNLIIISIILFVLIIYLVYTELNKKEILQKKVDKKTLEIRKLLSHELYLNNLLKTVASVNESLINSYSVGSIIETSLEKLEENNSYKLVAYGHVEDEKVFIRYVKGDKYNLITDQSLDLSKPYDYENNILKSSLMAVMENKTIINNDMILDQNISTNREGDYLLKSAISTVLKDEENKVFGVLTLFSIHDNFDKEEISLLENVTTDISMAINASKQRSMVEKLQLKQISNYEETILAFVDMIEHRDAYTAGHTLRVAKYCRIIAKEFKIEEKEINRLEKAAILHDIGKIATPDTILLKPGRLSDLEYNLIQEHVNAGYDMLSKVELYKDLAEIIKYHHERYDGGGYPNGMKNDEIPFLSQILMVADAFDAMTTNRIYKSRLTPKEAVEEISSCASTQFHPEVAKVASKVLIDVNIESTSQLPQTTLEKQRFAYFFNDSLTNTYNTQYLEILLNSGVSYHCLNIINVKNMTEYNKLKGWESGNDFLVHMANYLKKTYPNSEVFRYQGDDFIVLTKKKISIDEDKLQLEFDKYKTIEIALENIDTTDHQFIQFKRSLFNI